LQQAERYRRITFASGRRVKRNVQQEHRAIMEAAIARDIDAACGLAASHIQRTLTVFNQVSADSAPTEIPLKQKNIEIMVDGRD
jgi:GntR family transcriptional regulator, carbon starvation induced regulator